MAGRRPRRPQRGAALLIFLIIAVTAALTYVVGSLSPEAVEARRAQKTREALALAREALIGYALKYRDEQIAQGQPDRVYGYLPLPDLGTTRNNNAGCTLEGCDAANFAGNALNMTVVGRLPWRALGLPPLRDGAGECLWYVVSGSHQRQQRVSPMNWDTLGHLDVVVANGSGTLASLVASAHDRPVAIVFAPGPPLPGQNRASAGGDDVAQCGGNYDARNYLDPHDAAALAGIANHFPGAPQNASGTTGDGNPDNDPDAPKPMSLQGKVFAAAGHFYPNACPGTDCAPVANDVGMALTADQLFAALRKSAHFRTDINAMLDRMAECLRDGFVPQPIAGYAPPADKSAGRIPDNACYDDTNHPLGYFSHYRDLLFVAAPTAGNFTVVEDGETKTCNGLLAFAGQRGPGQSRATAAERADPANYLEDGALAFFTAAGDTVAGPRTFAAVSPAQTAQQDIVRCIPVGAAFEIAASPTLAALGVGQLASYDAATRTLTLGRENVVSGVVGSANAPALFGCAWQADARPLGSGLRAYFRFRFMRVGTNVGFNGFVFALADGERNGTAACGAAGSHLGYSGDNGTTPKILWPKIGIEFDQGMNAGYSDGRAETSLLKGRNDPCYTCGGGTANSHAAIVYWGNDAANPADAVAEPDFDDNVHGFPATPPASRPPPTNPADGSGGLKFVNLRGYPNNSFDSRLFHVRIEIAPQRVVAANAEDSHTVVATRVWILADSGTVANQIAAMKNTTRPMSQLYAALAPTLEDAATLYDVGTDRGGCAACATGETCGSDNICYRQALRTIRPGFAGSQRTTDQEVRISDFFVTWLP